VAWAAKRGSSKANTHQLDGDDLADHGYLAQLRGSRKLLFPTREEPTAERVALCLPIGRQLETNRIRATVLFTEIVRSTETASR